MLKLFAALLVFLTAFPLCAQEPDSLYRDILIDDNDYVDPDAADDAKAAARKLLSAKPRELKRQNFPKLRQRASKATLPGENKIQAAPFGLMWGATVAETQNQGIHLAPAGEKDYVNNFSASHLPKALNDFSRVDVTFGDDDKLWRIIAYGTPQEDTPDASKVMRLYKIYNDLLTKKYGHPQQFFTPAQIPMEKTDDKGRPVTVNEPAPIGNPQFLSQLQSGAAELYSTYYNDEIGAALAVNVDGEGKSYIVIDYKNLKILRERENQTLDAL